ncbi:MAG: right-handed parallel beta-helix repeat-containing protein [Dysgonamonadaceae bacterium]
MKRTSICMVLSVLLLFLTIHQSYGQGARYTGSYSPSSPVKYVGMSNFVIEGLEFANGDADLIALYNCENVIIRNNRFASTPTKRGIYLYNCKNVTIIDNTFENVQSGMVASTSTGVKFEYNDLYNIVGPLKGGDKTGVMAQFIEVYGEGNSISYNVNDNIFGESTPEDLVNVYNSNGTAQSPIMIKGNWIRGGGPSLSGGGINIGDYGGSYQIAEDNILVNPGQYGMGISGGHDMIVRNNKVYGSQKYFTNVGVTASNWYVADKGNSYNITVANNEINYMHKDGFLNNVWFNDNVLPVTGSETNKYNPSLSASILPDQLVGRARVGLTPPPVVDPVTPPVEDPVTPPTETPVEDPVTPPTEDPVTPPGADPSENTETPPTVEVNDPNIVIYLDRYSRICINIKGPLSASATVTITDVDGNAIFSRRIVSYHTSIRMRVRKGTYTVYVVNGDKTNKKELTIK